MPRPQYNLLQRKPNAAVIFLYLIICYQIKIKWSHHARTTAVIDHLRTGHDFHCCPRRRVPAGKGRFFQSAPAPLHKQLEQLEAGGVLFSRLAGRTRLYGFNPRYPFLQELKALLDKAWASIPRMFVPGSRITGAGHGAKISRCEVAQEDFGRRGFSPCCRTPASERHQGRTDRRQLCLDLYRQSLSVICPGLHRRGEKDAMKDCRNPCPARLQGKRPLLHPPRHSLFCRVPFRAAGHL